MTPPKVEPFDRYADRYDGWFERHRAAYESELRAVRRLIPEGVGLEVGVGSGRFASPLGVRLGVDPSDRMLEKASGRGVDVVKAVGEALPVRDSCLDYALMVTTLCFLDDVVSTFREVYRVLKPGGSVVVGFIDRESVLGRLYRKRKAENVFYRVAEFYSVDEVVSLLREAEFREFEFTQTIFRSLPEIREVEEVREGYGEGSFVVVRAIKPGVGSGSQNLKVQTPSAWAPSPQFSNQSERKSY